MLEGVWRKGNPLTLLVGMQTSTATMENCAGHRQMLNLVDGRPLLSLGLRLGEGTGALCAFPIIDSAVRMMNEMNNFDNAKITKYF